MVLAGRIQAEEILKEAKIQGILGPKYVWIGGDALLEVNVSAYPFDFFLFLSF